MSHTGGAHTSPGGCSPRRSSTALARPTGPCSAVTTASTTRMRRPSRTRFVLTRSGTSGVLRNRSTVSRAKWKSGSPCSSSTVRAMSPPRIRPCSMSGDQGLRACGCGTKASPSTTRKGRFSALSATCVLSELI